LQRKRCRGELSNGFHGPAAALLVARDGKCELRVLFLHPLVFLDQPLGLLVPLLNLLLQASNLPFVRLVFVLFSDTLFFFCGPVESFVGVLDLPLH